MTIYRAGQTDPTKDRAAVDVLAAYAAAERERLPPAACYCAAVEAWWRAHSDQTRTYATQQAVDVILNAKTRLRIEDA